MPVSQRATVTNFDYKQNVVESGVASTVQSSTDRIVMSSFRAKPERHNGVCYLLE